MNNAPFLAQFRQVADTIKGLSKRVKVVEVQESPSMSQINTAITNTITTILGDSDHDPVTLAPGSPGILIGQELDLTGLEGEGEPFAIHDNVDGEIAAITEKPVPVVGDLLLIEDSDEDFAKKFITIGSLIDLAGGGGGGGVRGFATHNGNQADENEDDSVWLQITSILMDEGSIFTVNSSEITIGSGIYLIHIYHQIQNLAVGTIAEMVQSVSVHQFSGLTEVFSLPFSAYASNVQTGRVISAAGQMMFDGSLGTTIKLKDQERVCGSSFLRAVHVTVLAIS